MEKSRKKKKYVGLVLIKNPFIRCFFFDKRTRAVKEGDFLTDGTR